MFRKKGLVALSALFLIMVATPAMAVAMQEGGVATNNEDVKMAISFAAAFAMGIASGACGLGQGRAVAAACDGMARNPSAGGQIRGSLIIGLVLIESLAIYSLLIGLVLIFLKWGT
jgi:F-type H+-transporting ATPase subunit c